VTDYKRCSQESVCRFRRVLLQARNMVAELMDVTTLADVLRGAPVADLEIAGLNGDGI
jgi:DNA-binding IscR family transcriptional regulator